MNLNAALTLFLEEYPNATEHLFAGNPVAEFIRQDVPEAIEAVIGTNERYLVRGSAGQGNWARVPWAAVFDRFVTDTAQDGYYVVYLVNEDSTGLYLSLNQGVTTVKKQYGAGAKKALRVRASDYLARKGIGADDLIVVRLNWTAIRIQDLGRFMSKAQSARNTTNEGTFLMTQCLQPI
jgi:5-methylcytosine-specific restriction enzyme A